MTILDDYNKILKRLKKKPRINGYISPKTETKVSQIDGLGLFATKDLEKNEVVAGRGGHMITRDEIKQLPKNIGFNYALEIYPGFYIAEISDKELDRADFINHSCNPNCKIINKLIMITKRKIKKGEELTSNFSNKKNGIKIACKCNSKNCKKNIYID